MLLIDQEAAARRHSGSASADAEARRRAVAALHEVLSATRRDLWRGGRAAAARSRGCSASMRQQSSHAGAIVAKSRMRRKMHQRALPSGRCAANRSRSHDNGPRVARARAELMPKYERLIARAKQVPACDHNRRASLRRDLVARRCGGGRRPGIIVPILVGPAAKIIAVGAPAPARHIVASRSSTWRTAKMRRRAASS